MNVFLKRLNNQNTKEIPVWFMRQAGRYMKEYHLVKNKFDDFITMCKNIDAVTEITLQPINRFEIDAAIIFSDILILLECLGLKVSFVKGKGPIVDNKDFEKVI
ncbi:MAG: uroporphyrinogen decarboxylase, partial [Rickettsiales bacterium]|nr:uroporphyrinogen decarboxylase [Rickettsiales bacterium]